VMHVTGLVRGLDRLLFEGRSSEGH